MPPPAPMPRTNSLAFAKTDCHTCTANLCRCDRKRPRCSSCSGRNIVCGGYPMQLTWSKSKPIQSRVSMFLQPTEDPFHLEPLSLQASIHVRDRNSRSRPHKPRKFKFVAEKTPGRKQISTESCEARIGQSSAYHGEPQARTSTQQSNTALDRPIHQISLGSPLPGTLDDDIQGKIRHPIFMSIISFQYVANTKQLQAQTSVTNRATFMTRWQCSFHLISPLIPLIGGAGLLPAL